MPHHVLAASAHLGLRGLALALGLSLGCSGLIDGGSDGERGAATPGEPTPRAASGSNAPSAGRPGAPPGTPGSSGAPGAGTTTPGSATRAGAPGTAAPSTCKPAPREPRALVRLSRREYDNAIADLLGDRSAPARAFAPEAGTTGFDTAADGATTSDAVAEQYASAARSLAQSATRDLPALLGCALAMTGEDACARQFIARFGRRAFRRPLGDDERLRFEGFYLRSKASFGFQAALTATLRAFLLAPQFLFHVEAVGPDGKLGPYELASRLSFLFWGTIPDEELLTAAGAGRLGTAEQVTNQARRLLADARGARLLRDLHGQWLGLSRLPQQQRGAAFTPTLAEAMRAETETYFERMVREKQASWRTLMTSPVTWVNADLAKLYGVPGPAEASWREVARQADRHRGFLTQPAFLTLQAVPTGSSPIHRGEAIRTALLCGPPLRPPPNTDTNVPAPDASRTARQRLEEKTQTVEPCKSCHLAINPIGFAFDRFDQLGRFRDKDEQGRPIDTSGALVATDVDGPFASQVDLIDRLAGSAAVEDCVVTQWVRYALARRESDADACLRTELAQTFRASGGDLRALVLGLVTSSAFTSK